jgi:non-ribosomal peptide synthetase component F
MLQAALAPLEECSCLRPREWRGQHVQAVLRRGRFVRRGGARATLWRLRRGDCNGRDARFDTFVATEFPGHTELTISCQAGRGMARRADTLLDRIAAALAPAAAPALGRAQSSSAGTTRSGGQPEESTVTRLFEAQVAVAPDAVALTGPAGEMTSAELGRRAVAGAAELHSRGVGPGAVVGLLADRSAEALAGLWGILKADAAYLPLDPRHPDGRLAWILVDGRAVACLTQRPYAARVGSAGAAEPIVLGELREPPPAETAAPEVGPDDRCYVIYTSGSTGRPKGVQVEHRSLVHYVGWATKLYGVDATTRFALLPRWRSISPGPRSSCRCWRVAAWRSYPTRRTRCPGGSACAWSRIASASSGSSTA